MRVLLDENLPHRLRQLFESDVEAVTVDYAGWKGTRNGELLRAAREKGFDVLISMDRGLPHQQDLRDLRMGLVLLSAKTNRFADLEPLMDGVHEALRKIEPGEVIRVVANEDNNAPGFSLETIHQPQAEF